MKKLGLDNKLIEELYQKLAEKDAIIVQQSAVIAEQDAQIKEKDKIIQSFDTGKIVDCIDRYNVHNGEMLNRIFTKMAEDGYEQFADYLMTELSKKDEFIKQIVRELNFLSLSATKKSGKYIPKDENGLAKGQTVDENNPEIKHQKKEDAKARGNNGAKHDQHYELQSEDDVIDVLPDGIDLNAFNESNRYVLMEKLRRHKLVYKPGRFSKQYYDLWKLYDLLTKQMIYAKTPDCPLKGSTYGSALLSDLIISKYAWHQTITTVTARYKSEGFNANEGTLNGLMMKLSTSLFFRNLDKTLCIALSEDVVFLMDETYIKMRVAIAKLDAEFIRKGYVWGILAANLLLIRYSCDEGSRSNEVGYSIVRSIDNLSQLDHQIVLQADAYSCYRNIENSEEFSWVIRIGCLQHTKAKFANLDDNRAIKITEMIRSIYHLDNLRIEQANQDALTGKEWTLEDHLNWRRDKMLPVFNEMLDYIKMVLATAPEMGDTESNSTEQPLSKALKNAMTYTLTEAEALERIFTCGVICDLDQSQIERANRIFSYLRRNSQTFGSIRAAENQSIFISLIESAIMHKLNVREYMTFLLQQMAIVEDCEIKTKDSRGYELYRNMLPDKYAETHKKETPYYEPPEIQTGPLNPGSKRCAYKKHRIEEDKPNPSPNLDIG